MSNQLMTAAERNHWYEDLMPMFEALIDSHVKAWIQENPGKKYKVSFVPWGGTPMKILVEEAD